MEEQFIHFPVRAEVELHLEALKLVDDEGSALVRTEFAGWLAPKRESDIISDLAGGSIDAGARVDDGAGGPYHVTNRPPKAAGHSHRRMLSLSPSAERARLGRSGE